MGVWIFLNVLSILVLSFSILLFTINRKWSNRELKRIESKRKEVEDLIASADEMINELNRFSDYVVGYVGDKFSEVDVMIVELDKKIDNRKNTIAQQINLVSRIGHQEDKDSKQTVTDSSSTVIPLFNKSLIANASKAYAYSKSGILGSKFEDSPINTSIKSRQIISLADKGLGEAEIAKKLNIGRGEIQLVLGMKNGTFSD